MNFIEEINELLGIDSIDSDIYVTYMPSKGVVVQGYKKLLEISDQNIVVLGKNKRKVKVCGVALEILSLSPAEIVVRGKVERVEEVHE